MHQFKTPPASTGGVRDEPSGPCYLFDWRGVPLGFFRQTRVAVPNQCADCGLLQILVAQTREYVAVEKSIRESGVLPMENISSYGPASHYEREFECLAGKPIR